MPRLPGMTTARIALVATLLWPAGAQAALYYMPHMGEYGKVLPGQIGLLALYTATYDEVWNRHGEKEKIIDGSADINAVIVGSAWVGNMFRDTDWAFLARRPQICGLAFGLGQVQAKGSVRETSNSIGITAGNNGLTDLYASCTVQDVTRRWGKAKGHFQLSGTVKAPIGDYDTEALLQYATHYWTYIPQLSFHGERGQLILDATSAYQFNRPNDSPSAAGLTPTRPADWYNLGINLGWKFTERWWADIGFSHNESAGSNEFGKFDVTLEDQPVPGTALCDLDALTGLPLGGATLPPAICNATTAFFVAPRRGPYHDRGVLAQVVTAGFYYVYRSSAFLNFRVGQVVNGRGSQFDAIFDACASEPCGPDNATAQVSLVSNGVGESGAVVTKPFFELRILVPFAAP